MKEFAEFLEMVLTSKTLLTPVFPRIKRYGPTVEVRTAPKVGRNQPCPCGCGKKAKKCNNDKRTST